MLELGRVSAADFEPLLHSRFHLIFDSSSSFDLELVEVTERVRTTPSPGRSPFTLLFKGDPNQVHPPPMYRIEQDTLGPMDLFISPVRADQEGCYYEAVFV